MTPLEKYETDSSYHALVDMLTSFIHNCQFSPSELREAALLASIRYESLTIRKIIAVPEGIKESLLKTEQWLREQP